MVIRRSLRLSSTGNLLPVTLLIQNHALAWSDSVHSWNCPNTLVTVLKELTKPHVTKLTEIQSYTLKLGQPGPFLSLKQNCGHTVHFSWFSPSLFIYRSPLMACLCRLQAECKFPKIILKRQLEIFMFVKLFNII